MIGYVVLYTVVSLIVLGGAWFAGDIIWSFAKGIRKLNRIIHQ